MDERSDVRHSVDDCASAGSLPDVGPAAADDAVNAGPATCADEARPEEVNDKLVELRNKRDERKQVRKEVQKELRNCQRRRQRLKRNARQLSNADLVEVLQLREALAKERSAAKPSAPAAGAAKPDPTKLPVAGSTAA